jgi:hypothetical protein
LLAGAGVATVVALTSALPAGATSATASISAGTLSFVAAPATAGFSATLNGLDQVVTATQTFDVGDATGSGVGWNVTATSTTFSTAAPVHSLSPSAVTVQAAPTVACDAGATCTAATSNLSYPYTLPAAATAPTATKIYNAAANTGLGNQTVTATMRLAIPANASAGTYSSVFTYSLVSGP